MKPRFLMLVLMLILVLCCASLTAQAPPAPPHPSVSTLGFSYTLPPVWQPVNAAPTSPPAKQNPPRLSRKKSRKQDTSCARAVFSARRGAPASTIVVVALPFACYGRTMTPQNLPGFAAGVSKGLKQHFTISTPVHGSYKLGSHSFWIERAVGVPKGQTNVRYTVEIACSILKNSAVCWMTASASAGGLRDFENGLVTLDGEQPVALVPENAFTKKPS